MGHGPRAMRLGKTSGDARTLEAGPLTIFTVDEPSAAKPEPEDHQSPSESGTPRTQDILVAQSIRDVNYDMQHHRCQLLAKQLTSLGAGTLINLWTSGMLFSKCKELGLRGLPAPPASWPEEAQASSPRSSGERSTSIHHQLATNVASRRWGLHQNLLYQLLSVRVQEDIQVILSPRVRPRTARGSVRQRVADL